MDFKPTKIGKYLLLERLATGGMAEVYLARATGAGGFEKQVAIKRILSHYSRNDEFRRMFEYEARLSSSLNHANIVQIFDFVKSGETYLLAMEYVDGKNLRQFVNKVKKMGYAIPIEFSAYVINEVCKGLEYAHNKKESLTGRTLNIIHRDMSPQNVMISYDGAVKIVDFGIAKAKDRVDETRSGVIKGKFGYMSPEQANGISVDHRTDIFSTAIILWELLTNRRLFTAENDLATLKMIQECVITKPTKVNPKIPLELEKILLKGLTKDPTHRFQNAGTFHRQLQEFMNKEFPSFTQRDAAEILHKVFSTEIEAEKKRFEHLHRQSIPFSQGSSSEASAEAENLEAIIEGSITHSEHLSQTAITNVESASADAEELSEEIENLEAKLKEGTAVSLGPDTKGSSSSRKSSSGILELKDESEISSPPTVARKKTNTGVPTVVASENSLHEQTDSRTHGNIITPKQAISAEKTLVADITEDDAPATVAGDPEIEDETQNPFIAPATSHSKVPEITNRSSFTSQTESGLIKLERVKPASTRQSSYSHLNQVSKESKEDFPLEQPIPREEDAILVEAPRRHPSTKLLPRQKSVFEEAERNARPADNQKPIPLFIVLLLIGAVLFSYKKFFEGWNPLSPRETAAKIAKPVPPPSRPVEPPTRNPNQDIPIDTCTLKIESDPPGANIFIDKIEIGSTPHAISVKCKTSVNLTYKLSNHEEVAANVFVGDKEILFRKKLSKVPMGLIEFTLDTNASVIIDGQNVGIAYANQVFSIPLRANMKHQVKFVNETFGLEAIQEISVQDGLRLVKSIKLTDGSKNPVIQKRKPTGKQNR